MSLQDLSLQSLPDLSDASLSFSFQIPADAGDVLLGGDRDDFVGSMSARDVPGSPPHDPDFDGDGDERSRVRIAPTGKSEIAAPDDARERPRRAPADVARAQARALPSARVKPTAGWRVCRERAVARLRGSNRAESRSAPAPTPAPEAEPPVRVPAPKSPMWRTGESKKPRSVRSYESRIFFCPFLSDRH
ncbi:hypothetical protein FB451DRAFT_1492969 [Mycena latifolia]|nr:hypothetical protein FB451DRAFT_1492969 [Mycena latifolia]